MGEGLVNLLFALFLTKIYSMDVAFGYEVSSACLLNPRICMLQCFCFLLPPCMLRADFMLD